MKTFYSPTFTFRSWRFMRYMAASSQ